MGSKSCLWGFAALLCAQFCVVSPSLAQRKSSSIRIQNPALLVASDSYRGRKNIVCNYERKRVGIGFVRGKKFFFFSPKLKKRLKKKGITCPSNCMVPGEAILGKLERDQLTEVKLPAADSCGLSTTGEVTSQPRFGRAVIDGQTVLYIPQQPSERDEFTVLLKTALPHSAQQVQVVLDSEYTASDGSCTILGIPDEIDIDENEETALPLPAQDSCGNDLVYTRERDPEHGTLSLSPTTYTPDMHFLGADSLRVAAEAPNLERHTFSLLLHVVPSQLEFAGDEASLAPYRERLTPREVRHFLRKVALRGDRAGEFERIGLEEGREALVDALLAYQVPSSVEQVAESRADAMGVWSAACAYRYWYSDSSLNHWLYQMLYGNPLKEQAALHLHDHFAIDLEAVKNLFGCATNWGFRDHYDKLRDFALGSFSGFTKLLLTDTAMSYWLDNRLNRYGADQTDIGPYYTVSRNGNQNFARELMELFTINKFDPYTGERTFTEADIELATRSVSGYHSRFQTYESNIPGYNGWYHGQGVVTRFESALAAPGSVSIFHDIPGASTTRDFTPESFIDYLLFEHPAGSRNIAYTWFSRYVYVHPPEEITEELSSVLRDTRYDMKALLRVMLNSSSMFSQRTLGDEVDSPVEHLVNILKSLNLPASSLEALATLRFALSEMNHSLLQAPNVFAWGMAGDNTLGVQNHGEPWLQNQALLNRFRSVNQVITQQASEGFTPTTQMFSQWSSQTPDQVIQQFEERFNLHLQDDERSLVRNYLDRDNSPWDPSNRSLVDSRLAGLAFVFSTHLKVITK
ncbi:MAG: DUF1800 family protein [Bdellovibrionales bacterium]|nr:DUF1800 family protein [Bdellovibrionales bacterium]